MRAHIHSIVAGREELREELEREGVDLVHALAGRMLSRAAENFGFGDLDSLFYSISSGAIPVTDVSSFIVGIVDRRHRRRRTRADEGRYGDARTAVEVGSFQDLSMQFARCCLPYPRDDIVAFVARGGRLSIHRTDCPNMESIAASRRRFVPAQWKKVPEGTFRITIRADAEPRSFILADVVRVLAEIGVETLSAQESSPRPRVNLRVSCELPEVMDLNKLLASIDAIEGVDNARRLTSQDQGDLADDM